MALVSLNLNPSKKQLRDFGLVALFMCNVIGLLLLWLGRIPPKGLVAFFLIGLAIYVLSRTSTTLIKPIYLAMLFLTFPIGWVVSYLAMGLFYYGIVTPLAVFFKILGRDPLCRKYDSQANTYWIPYKRKKSAKDYFHQF
jgi:polyferredoxin